MTFAFKVYLERERGGRVNMNELAKIKVRGRSVQKLSTRHTTQTPDQLFYPDHYNGRGN